MAGGNCERLRGVVVVVVAGGDGYGGRGSRGGK